MFSTFMRFAKRFLLLAAFLLQMAAARAGVLNLVFNSLTSEPPLTQSGNYFATGLSVNFTLNFAPAVGTNLIAIRITGVASAINGTFANLAQGQAVTLSSGGRDYSFVANYYGGSGNDLVLQWANTRPMAWGNDGNGQLGNNGTATSALPVAVTNSGVLAGKTILALSAGRNHSLALCSDGTVAAWGLNSSGQIGTNGGGQSNVPVIVSTLGVLSTKRVVAIAAGEAHSLALCSDGTVAAWGANSNGQLGIGGTSTTGVPTPVYAAGVLSGKKVVAIAGGQRHSMALLSTGAVVTWGYNLNGQLGSGNNVVATVPVSVDATGVLSGKTVIAIAAGESHCLALCSAGLVAAWGENKYGQLGNGATTDSNVPVQVTTAGTYLAGRTVTSLAAGSRHGLALCSDGTIAAWGDGTYGQLGNNATGFSSLPVAVDATGALFGKTVTSVAGGLSHSLAQCADGTLTAWGKNAFGELGTGGFSQKNAPFNVSTTPLVGGQSFSAAFSGPNAMHSLAIVAMGPPPGSLATGTLISNGSFENGFTDWTVSDINSPFRPLQVMDNGYNPGSGFFTTSATQGNFAAYSGFAGNAPGIIRMAHDVAVTAAEPFVRFDYRAAWDMLPVPGYVPARTFAVTIEPEGGGAVMQRTVILSAVSGTRNLDSGPLNGSADLSAFIGSTVRVCFDLTVPTQSYGNGFFQLDNVRTAGVLPASVNPITGAATGITLMGATLNGIANAEGSVSTTEFEYGPTTAYGDLILATPDHVINSADTPVTATLSGLDGSTPYHCRVKTTNIYTGKVKVGADVTFTTLPHAPAISSFGTSTVTHSSATFFASLNTDNASAVVIFEYGTTTAYGSSAPVWEGPISTLNGSVHAEISGLTAGTTYHYRVRVQNAGGTTYSDDATFTPDPLLPGSPSVTTLMPTQVDRANAVFGAVVNPNGGTANVNFQFGTTTNFNNGSIAGSFPSPVTGSADTAVVSYAHGLNPGTTYYCRPRVLGPDGFLYGPIAAFTTPAIGAPAASTDAATNLTQTTAVLRGFASGNYGPATTVSFEYGLDTNYGSVVTLPGFAVTSEFHPVQSTIPVSGESVTYHYRIKATNNIGTAYGQDATFTTPDPHEARLHKLTFSGGTLSPAFDRTVTSYTVSLPFDVTSLWLTPTASTGIASVTVNGVTVLSGNPSDSTPLNIGTNVFNIVVTALDGTTQQTYTVTVTRATPVAGNLDLSFGGTGIITTDIGSSYDSASAVVVQPDGRILVAGSAYLGTNYDFAVARHNPDGTPDTTFGATGQVVTDFGFGGSYGIGMTLQSDGKIVVVGGAYSGTNNIFAVARYNADGTPDTTFNGTGKVTTPIGAGEATASRIALQADGKIVVAGYSHNGTDHDFAIVRYHGDASTGTPGTLDTTFNGTGKVITDFDNGDDFLNSVAMRDGMIVVAGYSNGGGKINFALARYTNLGNLDTTFNLTGKLTTQISASGDDGANGVAVQPDGKIIAAGYSTKPNGSHDFALVRYNPDGGVDPMFGNSGIVTTDLAAGDDFITGIALQGDGKIVAAGYSATGAGRNVIATARYLSNGSLDTTFNGGG
ncbi:MAG: cadherin-like beta sandwich domain-containing protein, partial [Chthoniobacteraceae bacterium]